MKYDVTVAIPTLNAGEFLEEVIRAIFKQKTKKKFELLIIDSGSTDNTLEIIAKYPKIRLHEIPNTEFGHGKTRNLAAELADSEYIIFLTQDATPSHDQWLDYMIEPFLESEKVGAVFGKQIPRPDCVAPLKREVFDAFRSFGPDDGVILHRKTDLTDQLGLSNTFFSDVNSALRKDLLAKIPFRDVNYAEDQGMAIDVMAAGYYKAYAPLGSVIHSHNYPLKKFFKRKFDECVGLRESTGLQMTAGKKELVFGTVKATLRDWRFIMRDPAYSFGQKLHDFFVSPFYNLLYRMAIRTAQKTKITDKRFKKLSLEVQTRSKAKASDSEA